MAVSLVEQIQELMGSFNASPPVGVDIGSHSIKVCEVSGSPGKYSIEKFAVVPLSEAAIIEDEIQKPEEIIEAIQTALKSAGIKSKTLNIGLYGQNTMTKRMSVPEGTDEEIEDSIMWEAEQYIPFAADESEIDFHVLGDTEGGGKDTVVVAARIDIIERFQELLIGAKFKIKNIDLNVLAISNVFEMSKVAENEELDEGAIVVDWGAQSIKIVVYKNGGPIFTKEIPLGGGLITEEIQRQMAVSYEEAEDLKVTRDDNGNLPEEILAIIDAQLEQQLAEVKKSLNFYITNGSTEQVFHCFLTGGSALLPGLRESLSNLIGMEVEPLDIFSHGFKSGGKDITGMQELINSVGVVAVGLGMRK